MHIVDYTAFIMWINGAEKIAIAFKEDMPKTLVGKVAYRVLEEEEAKAQNGAAV